MYDIFHNPSGHRESFCLLAPLTEDIPFPVQDDSDDSDDDDDSDSDEKPAAKPAAKAAAKPASSDDDDDDDSNSDDSDDDKPAAKPAAAKPAAKAADSHDVRVSLHPLRQRSLVSLLPDTADDTQVVHIIERNAVSKVAGMYAYGITFTKKHHEDALKHPAPQAALLLVVPAGSQPPYADARSILLYTRMRRGSVNVVHTRDEWHRRGYAMRLARAVQDEAPAHGSLTVDSPGCTARAAVCLWLRAGFMGCEELLTCELADDSAYMGSRSVRVGFTWNKRTTPAAEATRIRFLEKVAQRHPDIVLSYDIPTLASTQY